jgi:hypothetical protein
MYTPQQKTQENEDKIYLTNYTPNYNQKQVDQANISLDDLMKPQFNTGNNDFNKDDNSVYNPDSDLGSSIFGKDSLDYYLDEVQKRKTTNQNNKNNNDKELFYKVIGVLAVGYLGYRFL